MKLKYLSIAKNNYFFIKNLILTCFFFNFKEKLSQKTSNFLRQNSYKPTKNHLSQKF